MSTDKDQLKEGGLEMIVKERQRQIDKEGYSAQHDRDHDDESLYYAAMAYELGIKEIWPWENEFKPTGDWIRDLVKAGALYHAEADRYIDLDPDDLDYNEENKKLACWAMAHCASRIDALLVLKNKNISTARSLPAPLPPQQGEWKEATDHDVLQQYNNWSNIQMYVYGTGTAFAAGYRVAEFRQKDTFQSQQETINSLKGEVDDLFEAAKYWEDLYKQAQKTSNEREQQITDLTNQLKEAKEEDERFLLHLIDVVWMESKESEEVPATKWAKRMIEKAESSFTKLNQEREKGAVKPLSEISDEDAIEVAKILRSPRAVYHLSDPKNMIESTKYWIKHGIIAVFSSNAYQNFSAFQYLIQQGYSISESPLTDQKEAKTLEMPELIKKHLGWHPTSLEMASVKYFAESGNVSGNLYRAIENIASEWANDYIRLSSDPFIQKHLQRINELQAQYRQSEISRLNKELSTLTQENERLNGEVDNANDDYQEVWREKNETLARIKELERQFESIESEYVICRQWLSKVIRGDMTKHDFDRLQEFINSLKPLTFDQ